MGFPFEASALQMRTRVRTLEINPESVMVRKIRENQVFAFTPECGTGCHYVLEQLGTSNRWVARHIGDASSMRAPYQPSASCCLGTSPAYLLLMQAVQRVCNERNAARAEVPVSEVVNLGGGYHCEQCGLELRRTTVCPSCN